MTTAVLLGTLHLLALGLGVFGIWSRARALGRLPQAGALKDAFYGDNFWGLAAILWISTGLWRALSYGDKGWAFYQQSAAFWIKMGLLALVLALEIWPMVTLIAWRVQLSKGRNPNVALAPVFARISWVQLAITLFMVAVAAAVARGGL